MDVGQTLSMYEELRQSEIDIITRLFGPAGLIQPASNQIITLPPKMQELFKSGCKEYFSANYHDALKQFKELFNLTEISQNWFKRIAMWNAAASAVAAKDNKTTLEILATDYQNNKLYGIPLWNLALALYREGRIQESLDAVKIYIARDIEKNTFRLARAELICACLSIVIGDEDSSKYHLQNAYHHDESFVSTQLRRHSEDNKKIKPQGISVSEEARKQLLELTIPKRPTVEPELSLYLSVNEREQLSRAIASIAEGDFDIAIGEIKALREIHQNIPSLEAAAGAAYLFQGRYDLALTIFSAIERSGAQMKGAALWNMACAQIQLAEYTGALQTLNKCAITEYKTKPQLWSAIRILTTESPLNIVTQTKWKTAKRETQTHPLIDKLPSDLNERRTEILARILKPRKISRVFRPDLGRLSQRDRQNIISVLDTAYRLEPGEAAKLILPLVDRFGDIYTLKAHAASYLLLAGDLEQAQQVYVDAERLQALDAISRVNYSHIFLEKNNLGRVYSILNQGINSPIADDYLYWLALAMVAKITSRDDAGHAAARAVASGGTNAKLVREILKLTDIPFSPFPSEKSIGTPVFKAAKEAIAHLNISNYESAAGAIESVMPRIQEIPEIGAHVSDPEFYEKPYKDWENNTIKSFNDAVKCYRDGDYNGAALGFQKIYQVKRKAVAINLSASLLMLGEPTRARKYARVQRIRIEDRYSWRIIYNRALALQKSGELGEAIRLLLQSKHASPGRLVPLLVFLCSLDQEDALIRSKFAESLDELRKSVFTPSDGLILTLAWALLRGSNPDIGQIRHLLNGLVQTSQKSIESPAQVKSMVQVRNAYEQLRLSNEYSEAVSYMRAVIETRVRQRQSENFVEVSSRDLEHSVGIELSARTCLIKALGALNEREEAIRELDEAETLVRQFAHILAPGFLTGDWHALAQAANEAKFPWAAVRYCEEGLSLEPDNKYLLELKNQIPVTLETDISQLIQKCSDIVSAFQTDMSAAEESIRGVEDYAPSLYKVLCEFIEPLQTHQEIIDLEELSDRLRITSRHELPDRAYRIIDSLVIWIARTLGRDEAGLQLDIDVYDERLWPRLDDDREGCCLITINARKDIQRIVLEDPFSERHIWEGSVHAGLTQYVRWTFYREDGFPPDSIIELPISIHIDDTERLNSRTSIVVTVGSSSEIVWPEYPTGALSPEDIPGQDLYGRLHLIRKLVRGLGQKRSQATFFLQAPRQMGKTSLLNFVKRQTPEHVLPVYVNLEKEWSKKDGSNLWIYLVKRLREEAYGKVVSEIEQDLDESHLILEVAAICNDLKKAYVLFLLDEFHFLFERAKDPRSILASFRDYLNIQENRIALMLADRYTRNELEKRCSSEYWDQLSVETVGPLDSNSAKQAIEYPTRGTDVSFLPETISGLHRITGGYPYHLQRIAQEIRDYMFGGPWLTALPEDVDAIIPEILMQDSLFTSGLCRPERIDDYLFDAIAALLEWKDLCAFLPELASEFQDEAVSTDWKPGPTLFLSHFKDSAQILGRLKDIGILRIDERDFFSPLLEQWLRKMRRAGSSIGLNLDGKHWQIITGIDGGSLAARDWQNLDVELVRRTQYRGKSPLREKSSRADDWEMLVKEVNSEGSFLNFLDSIYRLFIDERDERSSMQEYPWLYFNYHRMRLVRNYVVHRKRSRSALLAWDMVCTRALGGERSAYWPVASDEWRALQLALLRSLYMGISNAIEIASQRDQNR